MRRRIVTAMSTLPLALGLHTEAVQATSAPQADVLGGILRVVAQFNTNSPPQHLDISFPAISGVAASLADLTRVSVSGKVATYELSVAPSTTLPFVNHPDQWDVLRLSGPSSTGFTIQGLKVTYQITDANAVARHRYTFIRTCNVADDAEALPGYVVSYHDDRCLDLVQTPVIAKNASRWYFSLAQDVQNRREITAEDLLYLSGGLWQPFAQLPLSVREAVHDFGQSGTTKLANGDPGHCSISQAYYQVNFTDYFTDDFPGMWDCDANRCWALNTPWPYSAGDLNAWGSALAHRRIARVRFALSGQNRVGLHTTAPFEQVTQQNGAWVTTGAQYAPKPGDMFWRFENCWHAGQKGPNAFPSSPVPHAMTLMGPVETYTDAAGNKRISAVIFDGSSMMTGYQFADLYDWTNEKIQAGGFSTVGDKNGDGCVEPTELSPNPVAASGYSETRAGRKFCRYCGPSNPNCADVNVFCPKITSGYYFRRDYFVGEALHPEDYWEINYKGSSMFTSWNWATTSTHGLDDAVFADFDGDDQADALIRMPDGTWNVAYMADGDLNTLNWVGSDGSTPLSELRFHDFNNDGRADAFRRLSTGAWQVNLMSSNGTFGPWTSAGTDSSVALAALRFADFNADGRTDLFKRLSGGGWRVSFMSSSGAFGSWTNVGSDGTSQLSDLVFADFNNDGRADVLRRASNGAWTVNFFSGTSFGPWISVGSDGTTQLGDLRFHDFNGDGRADVYKRLSGGGWRINYFAGSTFGPWTDVGSDGTTELGDLRFADFDGDRRTDVIRITPIR